MNDFPRLVASTAINLEDGTRSEAPLYKSDIYAALVDSDFAQHFLVERRHAGQLLALLDPEWTTAPGRIVWRGTTFHLTDDEAA